jgi:GNAT superfamily N-acetyltransferase
MDPASGQITIEPDRLDSPTAADLVGKTVAELNDRYSDHEHKVSPLDPAEFLPPNGVFLIVRVEGWPAGCGGLRRIRDDTAEIKRMFVEPGARCRGLGRKILEELESAALRLGYRKVLLETGLRQPEAIQLYESAGYQRIAAYGEFSGSPLSICFEKTLSAP